MLSVRFTAKCPGSDDDDDDERVLRAVIFFTAGDSASLSKIRENLSFSKKVSWNFRFKEWTRASGLSKE